MTQLHHTSHLTVGGRLGCFQFLIIVIQAAVNILAHVLGWKLQIFQTGKFGCIVLENVLISIAARVSSSVGPRSGGLERCHPAATGCDANTPQRVTCVSQLCDCNVCQNFLLTLLSVCILIFSNYSLQLYTWVI